MPSKPQNQKTIKEIAEVGLDATGLSIEALYQVQALFSSISKATEKYQDIHTLAAIGVMIVDLTVGSVETSNNELKAVMGGDV